MATRVEYECDKCGAVQSVPEQMWCVAVRIRHYTARECGSPLYNGEVHDNMGNNMMHGTDMEERMWCRACVEAVGILPSTLKPAPAEAPVRAGLEELIVELIREQT